MNARFGMLMLLPALCLTAATQQSQEPKPAPAPAPEVTVIFADEKDADGKPRMTTLTAEQMQSLQGDPALTGVSGMRIINGALYTVIGGRLIPLPGGGASGCFDVNGDATQAKIAAAQADLIKQTMATPTPPAEKR